MKEEILKVINDLKRNWHPRTKVRTGFGYHGSSKGDEIEYTVYFNEYKCEWTSKDDALKGFIFKNIEELIN